MKNCKIGPWCLINLAVGGFFLAFGLMKFGGAMAGSGQLYDMVGGIFPVTGILLTLLVWLLVIAEIGGGLAVIGKKWTPRKIYQLALVGFIVITLVSTLGMHMQNPPQILWHLMLLIILVAMLMKSKCCSGGSCSIKK